MEPHLEAELVWLLDFDGAIYLFEEGYWVKIVVNRTQPTPRQPHGISYSLTLHDPDGRRLLGYDNAHPVKPQGGRHRARPVANDHWHRTEGDEGRPYEFRSAFDLVQDFLDEVERTLGARGVSALMLERKDKSDG